MYICLRKECNWPDVDWADPHLLLQLFRADSVKSIYLLSREAQVIGCFPSPNLHAWNADAWSTINYLRVHISIT